MKDKLMVEVISAVLANVSVDGHPDAKLNINLTIMREMLDKIFVRHEIKKMRRSK